MKSLLGNSRRPDVTFYKSGRIDITARVAHKLCLSEGDVIDVASDGMEYYLYVRTKGIYTEGKHEAQCWPTKKGSHNFRAHSVRLCHNVMCLSGAEEVARLPIGDFELRNGYPSVILIVRNNLSEDIANSQIPISYDKRD
mgnify:CR=1 FL=1